MQKKPETLVITNFSGRLSRILNGDINSGFAKFTSSFGYDPFSKPLNLTWLEGATNITGPINNLPQAGKVLSATLAGPNVHVLDQGGKWYQIQSATSSNNNTNSVVAVQSVGGNYLFGTSMEFYGSVVGQDTAGNSLGKLYIGGDAAVRSINPNGSGDAVVGSSANYTANVYKPLKPFAGKLHFGNGNTIGSIDNTGTVTSSVINTGTGNIYSSLNPALGTSAKVLDLEVTTANDYLVMATANLLQGQRLDDYAYDIVSTFGAQDGKISLWNGSNGTVTAATNVPSYLVSAIETYFQNNSFFAADSFGTAFNKGDGKILSLPDNKPPLPNAVAVNGNFMTWACAEVVGTQRYMSLYYYGQLDSENPAGLYRMLRWATTQSDGFVSQVPLNLLVSNKISSINTAGTAVRVLGFGKHYIGLSSANNSATTNFLLSFLVTSSGSGTPQTGVYETQTQLFSKRVALSQIRVYCEPVVAGNAFQLDVIDVDGNPVQNGTFTYTYGDPADKNERINFNPGNKTMYGLGIRVTNTGSTNMTIKKIEIDYSEEGK